MHRVWRLLALGVAAYLLILVTTFPAARVTGIMEERVSDLSVLAVSGSVFSGKAGRVVWQDLDLGTMRWQFRPVALLLGRIEYLIELTHPANYGQLVAGITLIGRAYVQNLELALLYRDAGDLARAREHLEQSLAVWKNADPEFRMAAEARALHAELDKIP